MMPTRIIVRSLLIIALSLLFLSSIAETKTADEVNNIEIYRKVSPGVVNISSVTVRHDFFYRAVPQERTGSGAIIDRKGYIVTNYHVIHNAQSLEATLTDGSNWFFARNLWKNTAGNSGLKVTSGKEVNLHLHCPVSGVSKRGFDKGA